MKKIRMLSSVSEKLQTISLYKEAFPEDSNCFIEYYYSEKCRDNIIFALFDDDKCISMVHLNPYKMLFCSKIIQTYYIVAVATSKNRRHEGNMTLCLNAAFDYLHKIGVPFCYLLPVDQNIYKKAGFNEICSFSENKELPKDADVYCIRDKKYLERQKLEMEIDENFPQSGSIPNNPCIMAKITNNKAFEKISGISESLPDENRFEYLRSLNIFICEEV